MASGSGADQELLGGGLDIEGWNYIKKDVAAKIADMTDRTTILRNTFPMVVKSELQTDKQKRTVQEICTSTLEAKGVIDVSFIGRRIFDQKWYTLSKNKMYLLY